MRAVRATLRLRLFLGCAMLALACLGAIAGGLWLGQARALPRPDPAPFLLAGAVAGLAVLGLLTWGWVWLDAHLARPLQALAARLRLLAHAEAPCQPAPLAAPHLGDLAPAAEALAACLTETRGDLNRAIARETGRLAGEKARLAALLADVDAGILLCSADHAVVFYNSAARSLLQGGNAPRLDQPVTACLREGPLLQALDRLSQPGSGPRETQFLATTPDGGAMFNASLRLVDAGGAGGYALTLRDVTAEIRRHAEREALLTEMIEDMRRKAANLDTLSRLRPATEDPLERALQQETRDLARAVAQFGTRYNETTEAWWPRSEIAARDLIDSLGARLRGAGLSVETRHDGLTVLCDGFTLVALMARLAGRLAEAGGAAFTVALEGGESPGEALLTLGWQGGALTMGRLEEWLAAPLDPAQPELTGRLVLTHHATDIWPEGEAGGGRLCLPLPVTQADAAPPRDAVYDFTLFDRPSAAPLFDRPLETLSYVVFDTETTGLLPSQGDEIVQIAALRVVGGRLVETERLDMLVDPGRTIPEAATRIHGITDAMIAGAPGIAEAGCALHDFARGAVLVAHNAPFDMAFLHKNAALIGRRFDNPVLDTVLLSAVLFGITEEHTLDALCTRLGVTIAQADRHTAMGDTQATAQAFLRMTGMLTGRGLATFGAVHAAMQAQTRLYRR